MTNQEIIYICKRYLISKYTINSDGSIDVDGNVSIATGRLEKLPLKFNKVSGDFYCSWRNLTTLEGCPKEVGGWFDCCGNTLESLDGYNGDYEKLYCDNKDGLILKHKRSKKLKLINVL